MAYNVIYQGTYAAPTIKDEEDVVCQIASVTNRQGESLGNRMEARIQVDNPRTGYVGMSKTALVFDDVEGVRELAQQLLEMADVWEDKGYGAKPAQVAPANVGVKRRQPNAKAPVRKGRAKAAA